MSNFTNDLHKHRLLLKAVLYNLANQLKERADNHDNSKLDPQEKEIFESIDNIKEKILIHMKNIIIVRNLLFKKH